MSRPKSSFLGRAYAVGKLSVKAGAKAAGFGIGNLFADKATAGERRERFLEEQVKDIVEEIGKLKGSVMKAGQFVSMYGDYFITPKFNKILRHLQADSPPVAWEAMADVLLKELGAERLGRMQIEPTPLAAASLGQVYLARIPERPEQVCIKVQYPGMRQAIGSDLTTLKAIFAILKRGDHGSRYDAVLTELREMLIRELDYAQELRSLAMFRQDLAGDRRYALPEPIAAYSTGKVLTSTFMPGVPPDHATVLALPQPRRNALGGALLELYFREIFLLKCVQTDPHFGNYRIQIDPEGARDRLVLLDFGSTREFAPEFVGHYAAYVAAAYRKDREGVLAAAVRMGLLLDSDGEPVRRELFELACLFMEPLRYAERTEAEQLEAASRLEEMPHLIAAKTRRLIDRLGLRPPPREIVLLDRKLMGIFVFLATLRALVPGGPIIDRYTTGPF